MSKVDFNDLKERVIATKKAAIIVKAAKRRYVEGHLKLIFLLSDEHTHDLDKCQNIIDNSGPQGFGADGKPWDTPEHYGTALKIFYNTKFQAEKAVYDHINDILQHFSESPDENVKKKRQLQKLVIILHRLADVL